MRHEDTQQRQLSFALQMADEDRNTLQQLIDEEHGAETPRESVDWDARRRWTEALDRIKRMANIVQCTCTSIVIECVGNVFAILGRIQDILRSVSGRISVSTRMGFGTHKAA